MSTSLKIIILAAGGSTRLGKSKQLLIINNETLIYRTAKLASTLAASFGLSKPLVVTGKDSEEVMKAVKNLPLDFIHNPQWQRGMGSSISSAISNEVSSTKKSCENQHEAVLLLCCDQVLLTVEALIPLIVYWQKNEANIVTSTYKGIQGIPVIFPAKYYKELAELESETGARKVIMNNNSAVCPYPLEEAAQDLDTLEDEAKVRGLLE